MTRAELTKLLDAEVEPYGADILTILCNAGYVVVPKEPTERMKLNGARSIGETMSIGNHSDRSEQCYRAMIAASQEDAE